MTNNAKKQNPELMNNDVAKWFGPFYFNKNESRIIVPKMDPSQGGSFNMASPYAILILLVIVALIAVTATYSI
jgi:uncharacterized membrane protein